MEASVRCQNNEEEGPMLLVKSYELSKTLHWCEHLINSIIFFIITGTCIIVITVIFSIINYLVVILQQQLS